MAVYRAVMADALPPGVPHDVAEVARGTLGGALALAARLPEDAGAELTLAAQGAFIDGVRLCAAISAAGALGLALFAAVALRRTRPGDDRAVTPEPGAASSPTPPDALPETAAG